MKPANVLIFNEAMSAERGLDNMEESFRVTGWTDGVADGQVMVNGLFDDGSGIDRDVLRPVIVDEIRKRGYKFSGFYHQGGEFGRPVINDRYVVLYSQRGWGGIMAEALNLDNSDGLAYCDWAWENPHGEHAVLPRPQDYER